jgi:hypothetical protein
MSERCILAVRWTAAGASARKAVGGFLRYVQHRDLHTPDTAPNGEVRGLLKYVAYRDQAAARAELFGSAGTLGSTERKAFADYVARSLEQSHPQLYGTRGGGQADRRRAVYRMVISPERADGLDLRRLTGAVIGRLETELGASGLQWMAAIHRNTAHPHIHLVLAGMRQDGEGFARVDLTKRRLAAMKEALALEIERQRGERTSTQLLSRIPSVVTGGDKTTMPALQPPAVRPALIRTPPVAALSARPAAPHTSTSRPLGNAGVLRLRAVAHHYRRQMERDLEDEAGRRGWERAA